VKRQSTALLLAAFGSAAWSQTIEPMDTIIVTATRTEIPLSESTVPVDVITRDEIELSLASDLAELLRFEAGIDIGRNGGPGQATSIFLRGTESNHTLVLLDGVRINPGTLGGAAIQNIAPEMIERVEIVKGTRSALFGTEAMGGVINIITRSARSNYAEAGAGAGSFDTRSAYMTMGAGGDNGSVGITINHADTAGFPLRDSSDIDRGYDNTSLRLFAERGFGDHRVSLSHWNASGRTEYLDFFSSPLDQDYENLSTAVELSSRLNERIDSKLIVSRTVDNIAQNQSADFVESTRLGADWQISISTARHVVSGGLYFSDENASTLSFGSGFDEDTRIRALFLQDQWSGDRQHAFLAVRLSDHDAFGSEFTWNAEYAFELTENWSVLAGAGKAFRAPDATDRFGFGGSPDLAPEIANEQQLGLRYRPGSTHSFSLELYRNDIDDLIEFDFASFQLRNIARAEIRGAELSWDYRGDGFSLRTSVVRQEANDPIDDLRLLRRAERSLTISMTRDIGAHRVGLSILASGDREDFGGVKLPGYAVVNLTGQLTLGEHWRVNGRIENLFNREYQTAAGFNMQELSGFLDINYNWR
jgi:vitamin B12 transporter